MRFEIGQIYECAFYKGVDENGNLRFDKADPNNWITSTAKVVKRTPKTLTLEIPEWEGVYKPRIGVSEEKIDGVWMDVEQIWTYEFRMYANWRVA